MDTNQALPTVARLDDYSIDRSLLYKSVLPAYPFTVKVEYTDDDVESQATKSMNGDCVTGTQAVNFDPEMSDQSLDELDNVSLKERLRWVLASKTLELQSKVLEESDRRGSELGFCDQKLSVPGNRESDRRGSELGFCDQRLSVPGHSWGIQRNDRIHSSEKRCIKKKSNGGKDLFSGSVTAVQGSSIANIKVELQSCSKLSSDATMAAKMPFNNLATMKKEVETSDDLHEDELDHVLLRDRVKLLSSYDVDHLNIQQNSNDVDSVNIRQSSDDADCVNIHQSLDDADNVNIHQSSECLRKAGPSALSCNPVMQPLKINRPRKSKKTVTDSIETAMEEDAPGLLQVLIEKGVLVNEIKLYGEPENNDALDDSSTEDNFAELEAVITKLFAQQEPLLKLGPLRCAKGEKASYCLACLFSLVEQARYLKFRNWPVEWGWCRDLQSFIFVFVRHNRMVLERPEYGYATYFFELVASLPIHWQIKRLVTVMKLTSCSRVTLIENKALMVGDDLTEGEARVLMEFGWLPNTGLATMLNYCDRVVHDRRNEKSSSEWSMKIRRLLMDGYNGGSITSSGLPSNVAENNAEHSPHIKPEPIELNDTA